MPKNYISPISMDALSNLCSELDKNNWIKPKDYQKYHVKRGLRNEDGTGVMAGLTRIIFSTVSVFLKTVSFHTAVMILTILLTVVLKKTDSDLKKLYGFFFSVICRLKASLKG